MQTQPQSRTPPPISISVGAERALLILCAAVSSLPPYLHYHFIAPNMDRLRYPWYPHFLPADFLLLRHLGGLSTCFPVIFGLLFLHSFLRSRMQHPFFHPLGTRVPSVLGVAGYFVFVVLYLSFSLICFRNLIVWNPEVLRQF